MICPVCHAQMIKVKSQLTVKEPDQIRCVSCRFAIFYRGLKPS